ncbi:uncharacterized protein [Littorina saxatilis]|uniref:uncharacterized protein n=1 Tax=Littorina saxatilis TaxID=31220 RepID=UPI0038B4F55E
MKTKRTVNITVEYPPEISKLTFESNGKEINKTATAMRNSTINILCLWKEGHPPQSVTLKKDGVELTSNESVQQNNLSLTEHIIHNVQCNDTGMISCEAPGARENMTELLYVKCGLLIADREFSFPTSSGRQTLEFPVTAFYRKVVTCQLWRYKATDNVFSSLPVDCTSQASLTGSVPNLTLTIQLPEGTSLLVGRWRLDLRNRDENGSVCFTIALENQE